MEKSVKQLEYERQCILKRIASLKMKIQAEKDALAGINAAIKEAKAK